MYMVRLGGEVSIFDFWRHARGPCPLPAWAYTPAQRTEDDFIRSVTPSDVIPEGLLEPPQLT
jgi:hypothetical protein